MDDRITTLTDKADFLKKWLSDPQAYPDEFKSWLASHLQNNPNIVWERSQIPKLPYSKLDLGGTITSADIVDGTITSADIADGTIVNADIAAGASIAASKLAVGSVLELNVAGTQHKVAFGYSGTQTTDGGGHVAVNHGLGVTPSCTLAMSDTGVSTRPVLTTSHNSTVVDCFFNAAGVSVAFWWLAIS